MALYCNLKMNMYVVAACLNTNSEGARKLLEQCDPKHFLLVELDIRKSASILHIEKTVINLLASNTDLRKYTKAKLECNAKSFHWILFLFFFFFL